jgi:hypothetical protein
MRSALRRGIVLLAALAAATASADVRRADEEVAVPPYGCIEVPGPMAGTVVAETGDPAVAMPGCAPRPVECTMFVHGGELLTTGAGASLAIDVDGHLVQAGPDTTFAIAPTADGRPASVEVQRGVVRVIDARPDAATPIRVATPALATEGPIEDVVARAQAEPVGSSICSSAAPIEVRALAGGTATPTTDASPCVTAGAAVEESGIVATAFAFGPSIADAGDCALAGGFDPTDVASGPIGPNFPLFPPRPPPPPYCVNGACTDPPKGPARLQLAEPPAGFEPPP